MGIEAVSAYPDTNVQPGQFGIIAAQHQERLQGAELLFATFCFQED